ncbi:MAG: glutathione peroxidase [Tissierellia bacterium]|nr:glutathione peroxidase [Tissierellia bacterium]
MNIYATSVKTIEGKKTDLKAYQNQVLLIVNTASQSSRSIQLEGLQRLYDIYKEDGFAVLAFPCNQFNQDEPGDDAEILARMRGEFEISFPIFSKTDVKGPEAHPLFVGLTQDIEGEVEDNFEKFLVDRDGQLVARFPTGKQPIDLKDDIDELI